MSKQAAKRLHEKTDFKGAEVQFLIEDWLDEILADLLAVDMIGPAYLYSFAAFALFMRHQPLRMPSKRYPSPSIRFEYLFQRLSQNGAEEAQKDAGLARLHDLWKTRLRAEHRDPNRTTDTIDAYRQSLNVPNGREDNVDTLAAEIAKEVVTLPSYQDAVKHRFVERDFALSRQLTEKLCLDLPIATRRTSANESAWSIKKIQESYQDARNSLAEEINAVRHILASAAPCRSDFDKELVTEFSKAHDPRVAVRTLWPSVNKLDQLVSTSIEAVSIARFYNLQQ
jgi:hypothetical protein